jgi:hypothetical protein
VDRGALTVLTCLTVLIRRPGVRPAEIEAFFRLSRLFGLRRVKFSGAIDL